MSSDVEFIKDTANWTRWPMLPLKHGSGFPLKTAVLWEAHGHPVGTMFWLFTSDDNVSSNMFTFDPKKCHRSEMTAEQVIEEGWKVD